jgi:hypothetical protein
MHMTTVAEIEEAIESLPEDQFAELSSWFDEYDEKRWDWQIAQDQKSGPLRTLMEKAQADFEAGKCNRL